MFFIVQKGDQLHKVSRRTQR